jgi:hypothetical protein
MSTTSRSLAALVTAKLASSGLTPADGQLLGIEALSADALQRLLPTAPAVPALKLVYYSARGQARRDVYRVRVLEAPRGAFGEVGDVRYLQPAGSPPAAYLPRGVPWTTILDDASQRLVLTEGELKAACACKHLIPTIGLGGVWSWRSAANGWTFLPELEAAVWVKRDVVICFDSDAAQNPQVAYAAAQLCAELRRRGAQPRIADLPALAPDRKTGLDDYVVARGAEALRAVLDAASCDELAEALWGMNARYTFISKSDLVHDGELQTQLNPHSLPTTTLAHVEVKQRTADGKVRRVNVAKEWLRWPLRRNLNELTYRPGQPREVDGALNLWPGWGVEAKRGDVGPWERLLDHLFTGADPAVRSWFERWLAFPVQHPGAKLATAALLWSLNQGVGKSLLGLTLKSVYGAANFAEVNQQQFEGAFNAWGVNKQFVLVDDVASVNRTEARDNAAVLKTRITQETLLVNVKYVAQYTLPDCLNYYLTSNAPDALFLEAGDRRFLVHEVTVAALPDRFYRTYEAWRRGPGPAALRYHLEQLPLRGFDRFTRPPATEAKVRMTTYTRADHETWVVDLIADPDAYLKLGSAAFKRDIYAFDELRQLYQAATGATFVSHTAFGLALAKAQVPQRVTQLGGRHQRLYVVRNADRWLKAPSSAWAEHHRTADLAVTAKRGRS